MYKGKKRKATTTGKQLNITSYFKSTKGPVMSKLQEISYVVTIWLIMWRVLMIILSLLLLQSKQEHANLSIFFDNLSIFDIHHSKLDKKD